MAKTTTDAQYAARQDHLRKEEKIDLEQQAADLAHVMRDPQGRRVIWRLLAQADMWSPVSRADEANTTDVPASFVAEGRRTLGLWLLAEVMEHTEKHWLTMQQEASNEMKRKLHELDRVIESVVADEAAEEEHDG